MAEPTPQEVDKMFSDIFAEPEPTAPAPEATAVSEPAAAAPEALSAPEPSQAAVIAPALQAPVTQAPTVDPYIQELSQQNRQLLAAFQDTNSKTHALLEAALIKAKPEQSPEDRAKEIRDAFVQLNTNPQGFVDALVQKKLDAFQSKLEEQFAKRDPQNELYGTVRQNLSAIYQDKAGNVVRPELGDQNFLKVMNSPETVKVVYDRFYKGQDPAQVIRDPEFHKELYSETRLRMAGATPPNSAQSNKDIDAQRQVLQGHGQPAAQAGGGPGQAQPGKAEDPLIAGMMTAKSPSDLLADLFKPSK